MLEGEVMRANLLFKLFSGLLILSALNIGCVMEDVKSPSNSDGEDGSSYNYAGCIDGQGVSTSSIQINFLFPDPATRVRVKRNGNTVAEFSQANATTTYIDDSGLREGGTYLYTCEALVDGLWSEGTTALQLSTLAVNAPVFSGIVNAVAQDANSVRVTWASSIVDIPVPTYSYQVFANIGPNVDWTIPPKATVLHGSPSQFVVRNLGDQLTYSFGVRACSEGNVCETNTVQRTLVTPDGGAPQTVGVTNLEVQGGKLIITAPWEEQNGGIVRRYVYVRRGASGGTNIADYVLQRTYALTGEQLYNPPQTLELPSIQEGITYHIIVQDEDLLGQRSAVTNFRTLVATDITPPSFAGITALDHGTPSNAALVATWTAIPTESSDPIAGGVKYQIYALDSTQPISANPCLFGNMIEELNVSDYTAGTVVQHTLGGLQEKRYYSVCVKAVDSLGNISANNNYQQKNTLDTTAPEFFGIQNLAYSNQTGELQATWLPSASEDIKEYRLRVWRASAPSTPTVLVRPHSTSTNGTTISSLEFSVNDGEEVFVNVEACDNTTSPFGTSNCTTLNTNRSIALLDVTPPPGFLGIRGATDIETPAEGVLLVKWHEPADWSDYVGFNIYEVNPSTQELRNLATCYCTSQNCAPTGNRRTSCEVGGLDPFKTYRLHVRAFDAQNNETIYLNPATSFADKRTSDTTPPVFSSNLVIGGAPDFALTWNAAVDNQSATEPGAIINYEIYQNMTDFDFSTGRPDGNLKLTTTDLTFQDSGYEEAKTYYYTVCAIDASGNRNCDENQVSVLIPDVTSPEIRNLTSDKTIKSKVWDLTWEMEDNISDLENMSIEIRYRISENGDLATTSDSLLYSGFGSDALVSGQTVSTSAVASLNSLSGPANLKRKINYLVTVRDEAGNTASSNITVDSDNILQLTEVKSATGPLAGANKVVVYGKGFMKAAESKIGVSTSVNIGGKPCNNVEVISYQALTCEAPLASVAGSVSVSASNPVSLAGNISSTATLANAYTYSNSYICDNPSGWGPEFAAGNGDSNNPFIICSVTHLNNIRGSNAPLGHYYRLGTNIDLAGVSFDPLGSSINKFIGYFNGDGHVIENWSYTSSASAIGFFGYAAGSFQITNLGLVNVNIQGGQSTGGLIGVVEGSVGASALISKVYVTGTITATQYVGGIFGRKQAAHNNFNIVDSYFMGSITATDSTGYAGGIAGFTSSDAGGFFQNLHSEGQIRSERFAGGLFGSLGRQKQLQSSYSRAVVTVTEANAGGLVGEAREATINNSYVEAIDPADPNISISGGNLIGGLVGSLIDSVLTNSESRMVAQTSSSSTTRNRIGGAVGLANRSTIQHLSARSEVIGHDISGGLIGEAINSTISNSYALGDVIADGSDVGGLIGKLSVEASGTASLQNAYAKGLLDTTLSGVGGLIGNVDLLSGAQLTMASIFSDSQVGTSTALPNQQYGGLIGKLSTRSSSQAFISDCFASGRVYGGQYVGGLIGGFDTAAGVTQINRCYSSAVVVGSDVGRGALIGNSQSANFTAQDTYWDNQVSTKEFPAGNGSIGGNARSYTTVEMQDYANSIYLGWDFANVWRIPLEGYPRLVFE